jgi:hypothetical protein
MKKRLVAALAWMVLLSGCAMPGSGPLAPLVFEQRVASSHVELRWTCSEPLPGTLRVEGLAANPWSAQEVRFLEVELVGVNARDQVVVSASAAAADILIHTNQQSPFRVELRPTGAEVRYDLFYQYRYSEEEMLAALLPTLPRVAQQLQRFMVRDACSPTQHRAR